MTSSPFAFKKIFSVVFLVLLSLNLASTCLADSSSSGTQCSTSPQEGMGTGGFLTFKGSIVPCGRQCDDPNTDIDESKGCTLCHLLIMLYNIFQFMISLLIIVSLVMITVGGTLYIVSAGNPSLKTWGKAIITKTLTGFGLFLVSWLIVFTVLKFISVNSSTLKTGGKWYEFDCDTESDFDSVGTGNKSKTSSKKCTDNGFTCATTCSSDQEEKSGYTCDTSGQICCGSKSTTSKKCTDNGFTCATTCSSDQEEKSGYTCDTSGQICCGSKSSSSGYTYQSGIESQKGDASSALNSLLDCMKTKLPDNAKVISSISDSAGMSTCQGDNWTDAKCAHSKNSCHYGGTKCIGKSYAVDLANEQYFSNIQSAAKSCVSGVYVLKESTHVHISVGSVNNCGCN